MPEPRAWIETVTGKGLLTELDADTVRRRVAEFHQADHTATAASGWIVAWPEQGREHLAAHVHPAHIVAVRPWPNVPKEASADA